MKDGEEKHKISGFSWRTKKRSKKLGKHVLGQKQGLHKCFEKVFGLLLYTTQDMFAVGYLRPVAVDFFSSLSLFPRKEREENEGAFPYFPFSSASFFVLRLRLSKRNVTAEEEKMPLSVGERIKMSTFAGKREEESGDVWGRKSIP